MSEQTSVGTCHGMITMWPSRWNLPVTSDWSTGGGGSRSRSLSTGDATRPRLKGFLGMDDQSFDTAVAAMAHQQAQRLRELGFATAAAEVEALLRPGPAVEEA